MGKQSDARTRRCGGNVVCAHSPERPNARASRTPARAAARHRAARATPTRAMAPARRGSFDRGDADAPRDAIPTATTATSGDITR